MFRTTSLLAIALTVTAPAASAQESTYRHSSWGSVGAGIATVDLTCPPCLVNNNVAPTALVRVGGTISNRWTGALDLAFRAISGQGRSTRTYVFSAAVYYYPFLDSGLNLNLGGGGLYTTETGPVDDISMNGLLLRMGVGYDAFLSETLALTPFVTYFRGRGITGKRNRIVFATPDLGADIVQIGLALTKP